MSKYDDDTVKFVRHLASLEDPESEERDLSWHDPAGLLPKHLQGMLGTGEALIWIRENAHYLMFLVENPQADPDYVKLPEDLPFLEVEGRILSFRWQHIMEEFVAAATAAIVGAAVFVIWFAIYENWADSPDLPGGIGAVGITVFVLFSPVAAHRLFFANRYARQRSRVRKAADSIRYAVRERNRPRINLNTATVEQLKGFYGIGSKLAEAIVKHRERNGSFNRLDDLLNVKGLGPHTFDLIRVSEDWSLTKPDG